VVILVLYGLRVSLIDWRNVRVHHRKLYRPFVIRVTSSRDLAIVLGGPAIVIGLHTLVIGWHALVIGLHTLVIGWHSLVIGLHTLVIGWHALVIGLHTLVIGWHALVIGLHTTIIEWHTIVMGCPPKSLESTPSSMAIRVTVSILMLHSGYCVNSDVTFRLLCQF
jgi:hypothetical protein